MLINKTYIINKYAHVCQSCIPAKDNKSMNAYLYIYESTLKSAVWTNGQNQCKEQT